MAKTILVTGASSGIGRAIAIACAKRGYMVVLNGRNVSRLEETRAQMSGEGHIIIPADLTDSAQRQALAEQAPVLDGVVHCAGIGSRVLCKMLEADDVQHVMDANFNAPVLLQAALLQEKKIAAGSSIVFIASGAATMPLTDTHFLRNLIRCPFRKLRSQLLIR